MNRKVLAVKYQIVSDSASDLLELADINFSTVPLHIVVDGTDFADDARLSVPNLLDKLRNGKSSTTACPSPDDWITAFHDADRVFCVTITSGLSGSYNSAVIAKDIYEEKHPDRKVYIIDSLATGSKMVMLCEKLRELIPWPATTRRKSTARSRNIMSTVSFISRWHHWTIWPKTAESVLSWRKESRFWESGSWEPPVRKACWSR